MHNIITLLITLLLIQSVQACPDYKHMETGDPAPCSGVFLNQPTNDAVRKDLRNGELRKKQIELKDLQISELSNDRDKWAKEAHKQAKVRHSQSNDLRNGFIVGIGLTLLVMFGVGQVVK